MHQEFESPEELKDTIKCFWYDRKDYGENETSFEVTPDGYAEIIFYFGTLQSLPSPFMMGLLNKPAIFHTKGILQIIGIRCYPWTVFDLLELKSGKDELRMFEHPITYLQSILSDCINKGRIEESIAYVKQYFLDARSHVAIDSMLFKAGVAMTKAGGTMSVSEVAEAAHATVRTLERKFKQSSGHTVKDVSGLMRFEKVRNYLWTDPDVNIAGLAHELGYTDQSHLSREFKKYSGTTPAAFARKTRKAKEVLLRFSH